MFCLLSDRRLAYLRRLGNLPPKRLTVKVREASEIFRQNSHRNWNGTPLQHSCLENPMDGGAWWAAVHGVAKSRTRLSDFTFTFHFHALEKEMATHSSILAWRIPGMGEPAGLPSMGLHRVGHNWSDLAAAAATILNLVIPRPSWEYSIIIFPSHWKNIL